MKNKELKKFLEHIFFDTEGVIYQIEEDVVIGNYILDNNILKLYINKSYYPKESSTIELLKEMGKLQGDMLGFDFSTIELNLIKEPITKGKSINNKLDNTELKLQNTQTGIAAEYYVAGELSRLGYNVTFTFGNTKSIDLLIEKDDKIIAIQVKGIQKNKSLNWNLDKTKVKPNIFYVLVNLHIDMPSEKPEFFVLNSIEVLELFSSFTKLGDKRTALSYKKIKSLNIYQDKWDKLN